MAALLFDIWMDICDLLDFDALVNLYKAFDNIDAITAAVRKRTQVFLSTLITTEEINSHLHLCLTHKNDDDLLVLDCEESS